LHLQRTSFGQVDEQDIRSGFTLVAVVRLRRTSPSQPGWTRRRSGRGFIYLDERGDRISDPVQLQRLRDLVVPPAWRDVWLCPFPNGHLQAVGTDDRGRRQYLYHPQWREQRGKLKHAHVLDFARRLPAARQQVAEHLARPGMPRERTLATAFRLLDLGLFRIGGEDYAAENGSYGLATLRKDHVRLRGPDVVFEYRAKSGNQRSVAIADPAVTAVVSVLKRRRGGGPELLAWRNGNAWADVTSDDINGYVKQVVDSSASAKDFRTWHATVLAAAALARATSAPRSATAVKREVARTMREVAAELGNTPAVCRASYVDPRVIDRFQDGTTIRTALERAHRRAAARAGSLLTDPAIERAVLRLLAE
jgi:DNA topoisomerase IB